MVLITFCCNIGNGRQSKQVLALM